MNRLARAYAECGKNTQAISTSKKVLKIDPVNPIASKCLAKWKASSAPKKEGAITSNVDDFLEEPGKTKIVKLLHLGDLKVVNCLTSGDEVKLLCHAHRVSVTTEGGKYIGRLADDVSMKLRNLIKNGYLYKIIMKSVSDADIKIFIRETRRGTGMENLPSFPAEKITYIAYTPPPLIKQSQTQASFHEELQE